jgi:probable rRNA maturation factor
MPKQSPDAANIVEVTFRRSGLAGHSAPLRRFTVAILDGAIKAAGWHGVTLSVLYCDRPEIRRLNREFRGIDEETDVLSFPAFEDPADMIFEANCHHGDLAICLPYTADHANEAGRDLTEEVALLLVHGYLHLLGHDHDTAAKKKKMWKETADILKNLKSIPRPLLALKKDS